jgi:endonuclease YncB( thermonuclease family)
MRRLHRLVARGALAIVATSTPVLAQTAIDGSRFKMGDTTYRLFGMEAPDPEQVCRYQWPAGTEATKALDILLHRGEVTCEDQERNKAGERVAICTSGGNDLGAAMVRSGMAWADLDVSRKYVVEEARAAADHVGVHGHLFQTVWRWRAKHRPEPQFKRQEGSGGRADGPFVR